MDLMTKITSAIIIGIVCIYLVRGLDGLLSRFNQRLSLQRKSKVESDYLWVLYYVTHRDEFRERASSAIATCVKIGFSAIALLIWPLLLQHLWVNGPWVENLVGFFILAAIVFWGLALWIISVEADFVVNYTRRLHNLDKYKEQVKRKLGYLPELKNK